MTELGTICAVVVTYHCGQEYRSNLEAILPQVDYVIIIDNGSDAETISVLDALQQKYIDRLTVIFNDQNIGLGAAQNLGIEYALHHDYHWVLLLDHDSRAEPDMIAAMATCYEHLPHKHTVGILAPRLWDENAQHEMPYITALGKCLFKRQFFGKNPYLSVLNVIASGSLIKRSVLLKEGALRGDFFIDYIDTEFSLRAISKGWRIIAVRGATLTHQLGKKKNHLFVTTSNHSATRRHTIYRNRVIVWKLYWSKVPGYIIYDISAVFYDLFRIMFFESDRKEKLKQLAKGFWKGIKT